jgi:hypothetical protein
MLEEQAKQESGIKNVSRTAPKRRMTFNWRRYIPEDRTRNNYRCENLNSYTKLPFQHDWYQ